MVQLPDPFEKFEIKSADYDGNGNYGRFVIEPLERGFGLTVGNALRRVLLSSLPGASIYAIEVEGARHEFSALDGVEEDVTMIVLNLKELVLKIDDDLVDNKRLEIDVKGPAVVTAGDIVAPTGVSVVNKDLIIAHVVEGGHLKMVLHARNGRGYVTSAMNKVLHPKLEVGVIATDSIYSPVSMASYKIEPARVGHDSKFDRLTLEVITNGSITPQGAVALAAKILVDHFSKYLDLEAKTRDINIEKEVLVPVENKYENTLIEELDLSVRSYNCLKRAGIQTVLELTEKSEDEMIKVKNLGKKSLKEIKEKLAANGLSFRNFE
ncbi:MAG: DNA-directed RNA polymerase subunit alpha [Erysipelotrichaceae bacterium]|jgi:DNA-directed RNA polymerase subunit alpha|nr:DNA-directed RNA polymerase subunit alpha [Erysipelotrichaceae bacterium]